MSHRTYVDVSDPCPMLAIKEVSKLTNPREPSHTGMVLKLILPRGKNQRESVVTRFFKNSLFKLES